MLFAPRLSKLILHAPVLAVVNFTVTVIPVVYAVRVGVREAVYVSEPVVEAVYTNVPD